MKKSGAREKAGSLNKYEMGKATFRGFRGRESGEVGKPAPELLGNGKLLSIFKRTAHGTKAQ